MSSLFCFDVVLLDNSYLYVVEYFVSPTLYSQKMPKKFLFILTAFFIAFTLVNDYFVGEGLYLGFFHEKATITNLFFFILTSAIHSVGVHAEKKFKQSFAQVYLLIISTRLFGSLSYFLIMWSYHYDNLMAFTLSFLFLYFSYTVFEISILIANLRPHLKS